MIIERNQIDFMVLSVGKIVVKMLLLIYSLVYVLFNVNHTKLLHTKKHERFNYKLHLYSENISPYLMSTSSALLSKHWEIVPDFRFTKKPTRLEVRPGFGIVRKDIFGQNQLVQRPEDAGHLAGARA